jgi:hypothetical protein
LEWNLAGQEADCRRKDFHRLGEWDRIGRRKPLIQAYEENLRGGRKKGKWVEVYNNGSRES